MARRYRCGPFDSRSSECCSRCVQGWHHAVAHCSTIRYFPIECAESIGVGRTEAMSHHSEDWNGYEEQYKLKRRYEDKPTSPSRTTRFRTPDARMQARNSGYLPEQCHAGKVRFCSRGQYLLVATEIMDKNLSRATVSISEMMTM
jgi:hypothetical protein